MQCCACTGRAKSEILRRVGVRSVTVRLRTPMDARPPSGAVDRLTCVTHGFSRASRFWRRARLVCYRPSVHISHVRPWFSVSKETLNFWHEFYDVVDQLVIVSTRDAFPRPPCYREPLPESRRLEQLVRFGEILDPDTVRRDMAGMSIDHAVGGHQSYVQSKGRSSALIELNLNCLEPPGPATLHPAERECSADLASLILRRRRNSCKPTALKFRHQPFLDTFHQPTPMVGHDRCARILEDVVMIFPICNYNLGLTARQQQPPRSHPRRPQLVPQTGTPSAQQRTRHPSASRPRAAALLVPRCPVSIQRIGFLRLLCAKYYRTPF